MAGCCIRVTVLRKLSLESCFALLAMLFVGRYVIPQLDGLYFLYYNHTTVPFNGRLNTTWILPLRIFRDLSTERALLQLYMNWIYFTSGIYRLLSTMWFLGCHCNNKFWRSSFRRACYSASLQLTLESRKSLLCTVSPPMLKSFS